QPKLRLGCRNRHVNWFQNGLRFNRFAKRDTMPINGPDCKLSLTPGFIGDRSQYFDLIIEILPVKIIDVLYFQISKVRMISHFESRPLIPAFSQHHYTLIPLEEMP